jgi:predicted regulator of Ras-like GTPase activity (Roadblock/LC7/MglB family)
MFQALLIDVVESTEGALASLVMDLDGITLDSYSKPKAKHDIKTVGIELTVVLRAVRQAAKMLEAGDAREVAIVADQLTTLVRIVNDNYFVALSLAPGGNLGRARYLLRTRVPQLLAELS